MAAPLDTTQTAQAKNRRGASSKVSKASKKKSKRTRARRTYTRRGNPEVTRNVATQVIIEKLPELATIAGLSPDATPQPETSSEPVALTGTTTHVVDAYQDSELNDDEDTDGITAEDEEDLEDLPTDINSFYKEFTSYMASLNSEYLVTDNGIDKQVMMETLMDWLGTRYLFGGMGRDGIDCSAFTGMMYRAMNYKLPRTAAMQWDVGTPVERENLQVGDLVFFHTRAAVYVSHVGMYLGNNMFAHASSRNGVTVSSLDASYYDTHFIGGRRYEVSAPTTATADNSAALSQY
jgi:cell wall-associated NlpC family hydrolase